MDYLVDVVIPTYRPNKMVMEMIKRLETQTYPIHKIIIMNTEEKYFEQCFYGTGFLEKYKNIEVHHLSAKEFDHGKTRNQGIAFSDADFFICMTQDAMPEDDTLVENLVAALLQDERIAAAYAKQLPTSDCREIERYTRQFNYPEQSRVKTKADIPALGIKTFFCSNVCAIYRRDIYNALDGFVNEAIFNEDMIYAGKAIFAEYKIAYAANAKVVHSHNYSCMQQFRRNFDLGVSQAQHPEVFAVVSSESEGKKLVKMTVSHLKEKHMLRYVPYFCMQCGFKLFGYKLGMHYEALPYGIIKKCTSNKYYWEK